MKSSNSKTKATLDEIRHAYDTANPSNRPKQGGTPLDAVMAFKKEQGYIDLDDPEQKRRYLSDASTNQETAEAERLQAIRAQAKQEHKQALKNLSRYERISAAAGNVNPKPMTRPTAKAKKAAGLTVKSAGEYKAKRYAEIINQGGRIEFSKKDDPNDYRLKLAAILRAKKSYGIKYITVKRLSDGLSAYVSKSIIKSTHDDSYRLDLPDFVAALKAGDFVPIDCLSHQTVFHKRRLLQAATKQTKGKLHRVTNKGKLIGWTLISKQA